MSMIRNRVRFSILVLAILLFGQEAYVGQAHLKSMTVESMADGAPYIFKVEPVSHKFENVIVRNSKTGKEAGLQYLKVKILEILKQDGSGAAVGEFKLKSPNQAIPAQRTSVDNLAPNGHEVKIGDVIFVTSLKPIEILPPPEKSYYVEEIESPAMVTDKAMFFFASTYDSSLSAWLGTIDFGLVALSKAPELTKALRLRFFFDAVRNGKLDLLREAIAKYPEQINSVDPTWGTPLQFAARYGKKEHIELLVAKGASFAVPNGRGEMVLFDLINSGFADNLSTVIHLAPDLNARNSNGQTCLHVAVQGGRLEATKALLAAKADRTLKNADQETALQMALRLGQTEIVKLLENQKTGEEQL
jgi:hypothetical protein